MTREARKRPLPGYVSLPFPARRGNIHRVMSANIQFPGSWPRRRVFAVLVASAGIGLTAGLAAPAEALAAARCPAAEALPRVSLETHPGKVIYNTLKNRRQLQRLQGQTGASSRRGWRPIGLTLTELEFRMNISVNTMARKGRGHCATVAGVKSSLGYDKITIYIAKRYPKGSCQYLSVLAHENEHLAIFRDTLAVYGPRVERRLTAAASAMKPVLAPTPARAAAKIQKALQREMEPLFKEMNRRLDIENDRIDTPLKYHGEQARCSTW